MMDSHYQCMLWAACQSKSHDSVRTALKQKDVDVDAYDSTGRTALMITAMTGCATITEMLLTHGANMHLKDNNGLTAVELALKHARTGVANVLFRMGAEFSMEYDTLMQWVLFKACRKGDMYTIKAFLRAGVDVNSGTPGYTPLCGVIDSQNPALVKLILAAGAEINVRGLMNDQNAIPLWRASMRNSVEIVYILIAMGADVGAQLTAGITLHYHSQLLSSIVKSRSPVEILKLIEAAPFPLHTLCEMQLHIQEIKKDLFR